VDTDGGADGGLSGRPLDDRQSEAGEMATGPGQGGGSGEQTSGSVEAEICPSLASLQSFRD
jgi:hypothetical protein